jgi:hypothetical protein
VDNKNLFLTRTTYLLLRLEYLIALGVCIVLALAHLSDIRWPVFLAMFAVIDVIGYLPGLFIWIRRHGEVPRAFYVSYNVAHHLGTSAALAGIWCLVVGPEWALLALPIHLMGDRALFGNMLKPFGVSFEPRTNPAYAAFAAAYRAGATPASATEGRSERDAASVAEPAIH